ncbi:hypothetical protein Syun_023897 [Stephania yunnanensis]|uniref:Uncharacterized protein n=1 Tax=Stephania yunnanensis TaxID=152371 RepID=A0AAP0F9V6_9MAGN
MACSTVRRSSAADQSLLPTVQELRVYSLKLSLFFTCCVVRSPDVVDSAIVNTACIVFKPSNADEIKEDACSSVVDDDSYAANLMAFDSHRNEKEVRVALERTQASLAEALERTE